MIWLVAIFVIPRFRDVAAGAGAKILANQRICLWECFLAGYV